ncbi:MogA/MoaB family molybdenum cofactor biosynthesis protein [Gloeothece verrucosa]|uniref:Molybdenum cofactor biosynthesis protein B n=1 Tax=Gloeothece verrucosa (strain PCC 7822) TaxID=497965 RepID=E0UIL7_GLOV7|nr:MogA/MoaB family molybdenum cofactor biosynthesis protein [Gloeothece verrucosa]ADN12211.1 molybdenum cofactor synthesis domain protein [Gloeothece verrucosa PCC 7822]
MTRIPHQDQEKVSLKCAVITVSDTRTRESDRSGQLIEQLLQQAGHQIEFYSLIPDEPQQIQAQLTLLSTRPEIEVVIFNGGTGIAPRDTTYDALVQLLEKTLPGFGELFRWLSYQEIGSRAIASRAIAGIYRQKLIFSLPGSTNAVKLALEKLIIPEVVHLTGQLRQGLKD